MNNSNLASKKKETRAISLTKPDGTKVVLGGDNFHLIAGPCSIESLETLESSGRYLIKNGLSLFRGGVFKMRTKVESFQGMGTEGLLLLKEFRKKFNLLTVVEITDAREIGAYIECVDIFQVGSRNMYNYPMLIELGKAGVPVLLKRAFSATFEEWIGACGYIEQHGNNKIILCERGIRTFDTKLRSTLDLGTVALLKSETDYPVFVDPSHAAGRADLVTPLALAAKAVGADGLLVEMHPNPEAALSDKEQAMDFGAMDKLIAGLDLIHRR